LDWVEPVESEPAAFSDPWANARSMHYSAVCSHSFFPAMGTSENTRDATPQRIEQLKHLEYEIRRSITVREDQEDTADPQQIDAAHQLGIAADTQSSKGDLLSLVQTHLRAAQAASP
jgi:hypothetical protein